MTALLLTVLLATALVRLTMQVVAGDLVHAARYPADPVDTMAAELVRDTEYALTNTNAWQDTPHYARWEQEFRNAT